MNLPVEPSYKDYCEKWDENEEVLVPVIKQGLIEFRNASIRYRDDLPNIVSNLSVTIKHGEKVGIVGRTGSGKSTIINALIRITEVSGGSILIDNVDIKDIFLKSLRSEITVIDQEPVIIESTFRENLDLLGRYSDDDLLSVLKECNILGMIEEKGGLEGRVDKNSLSMGEKQLLCICRAFLKDSKIILIDEATASIDVKNDALIQSIIASKFQEKTVLTIAHRLTTISNYDKIIVLDKGVLIEFGSPSELLQNRGIFF
jgi:ABC-type multidrug transport system fused ATPase/permease subunit